MKQQNSPISADIADTFSRWRQDYEQQLILLVYRGYLAMCRSEEDPKEVSVQERAITQDLSGFIQDQLSGLEPFRFFHSPSEFESQKTKKAKPPEYDMGFISREKHDGIRIVWPLEAKRLKDANDLKDYVKTINDRFLTSTYAPFLASGAMVGYLFRGLPLDVLQNLSKGLGTPVHDIGIDIAPCKHGVSDHTRRILPKVKLSRSFTCHHIIVPFGESITAAANPKSVQTSIWKKRVKIGRHS